MRRVLLFGGVSSVTHYSCFARIFSVSARKICGLPVFNYFDDFGPLVPDLIKRAALHVFLGFTSLLWALMTDDKSHVDRAITFLGLWGELPCPDNDMIHTISLHGPKKGNWAYITIGWASKGASPHKDLGELIGKLSFTQTSVFSRFGRALLMPLRDKLKVRPFAAMLSADEIDIIRWFVKLLSGGISRICFFKSHRHEVIVYADAETSAIIVASIVIDVKGFGNQREFRNIRAEVSDHKRGNAFILTTYIFTAL